MSKNIEMNYFNGSGYDQIYPKTSGEYQDNIIIPAYDTKYHPIYFGNSDNTDSMIACSDDNEAMINLNGITVNFGEMSGKWYSSKAGLNINYGIEYEQGEYSGNSLCIINGIGYPSGETSGLNAAYGLFGGCENVPLNKNYANYCIYGGMYQISGMVARTFNLPRLLWESYQFTGMYSGSAIIAGTDSAEWTSVWVAKISQSLSTPFKVINVSFGSSGNFNDGGTINTHIGDSSTGDGYWFSIQGTGTFMWWAECK